MFFTITSRNVSPTNPTEVVTSESPEWAAVQSGCIFPFTYKWVKYDKCTKANHDRLWCSKDAVYKGKWKNCIGKYCAKYFLQIYLRYKSSLQIVRWIGL